MIFEVFLITLLITLSSALSTITGFGTSTISIPILLHFFSLSETVLFVGIIHCAGAIIKMFLYRNSYSNRLLLIFGIPSLIASFLGALINISLGKEAASLLLGSFLISYVTFIFLNPTYTLTAKNKNAIAGGVFSGFLAGMFGLGGALRAVFLTAFNLPKTSYLFTTNVIAFFTDITRLTAYVSYGIYLQPVLWWSLFISLPFSFLGSFFARSLVHKIPEKHFRLTVSFFLGILALKLIFFPVKLT